MRVFEWSVPDNYDYILFCTKEDAMEIIDFFGPNAKAPTFPWGLMWGNGDTRKYSHYILDTKEKIITPIRDLSWISHPDWTDYTYVGKECSLAVILDNYRFLEYDQQ